MIKLFRKLRQGMLAAIYSDQSYQYPYTNSSTGEQSTIGYVPLNFNQLKKDPKFLMLLDQTETYRDYKLNRYQITAQMIKEVVTIIDRVIN